MAAAHHDEIVHFEYPPEVSIALEAFVPDATHRHYFLRDGVELRLRSEYWRYLLPTGEGALITEDGYSGIPSLWVWFRVEPRPEGLVLVFTSVHLAEGSFEGEDDS